jgi:type II restriction/modification system DNA methylase subunit YeeA
VDVIVGNPPYIGVRKMRQQLEDRYVEALWAVYEGRVDRRSDYVCYWFEKAREAIAAGRAQRAGLLATQAIRGGANRLVLEKIKETGGIFYAQADRKWILDGAAVRVSMVGFDDGSDKTLLLNEDKECDASEALDPRYLRPVEGINANLTSSTDVTKARRLRENMGICFQGPVVVGLFDIPPPLAKKMLASPNPHGKPNSEVIFPYVNAADLARRSRGWSIIDFRQLAIQDAAKYEAPFEYVKREVKPKRDGNRRQRRREYWWQHGETAPGLKLALSGLARYVATPRVARHRLFVWLEGRTFPDSRVYAFARSDDYFFGVLQSRVHEVWSLTTSSRHGVGNDPTYNNTTCFETFPFPHGTQEDQWAISLAAKELDELREGWLNPEGMIGAAELRTRTLTELYNARPEWLADAHAALDAAVFAAYGWREAPGELSDAEIIGRLLALNMAREPA